MSEIVTHNYSSVNRAIDTEIDKYRAHNRLRYSKVFLNLCAGLGLLILMLAIAWYIIGAASMREASKNVREVQSEFLENGDAEQLLLTETVLSTPEENLEIREDLQSLESRDETNLVQQEADVLLPPERQYTVFTSVITDTGETIVTGRNFEVGEWDKPYSQYCYLDLPGLVGGTQIVGLDGAGQITLHTTDDTLVNFAREYCRFE